MRHHFYSLFSILTLILPIHLQHAPAYAAGYELLEQSGKGLGQAYAGASTGFGDGSEIFFNPAAISELPAGDTFSAHLNFIIPHAEFSNQGSRYVPQLGGVPLAGNNGGDGGEFAVVPNLYWAHRFDDTFGFGFGLNSPFGLVSEYNDTWLGRYHAIKSSLEIININSALSVRPLDMLSLGISMHVMHADAELTNAIDFGTIGVASLGLPAAAQLGLFPQQADGLGRVNGDDWGVGMGLAALITPTDNLRLGISYRSKVDLELKGRGRFTVPANATALTSSGLFTDTGATADVELPESVTFGGALDIGDGWTLFADAAWIRWSRFKELRIVFDSIQPDLVQDENWDDTWRYSVGARFELHERLALRAGFTFDETPIPSAEYRTPRIPDNDRYWMAFGVDYELADAWTLSASYAHIFVSDASTRNLANSTGALLNGDWELGVDVVGVSLTARL